MTATDQLLFQGADWDFRTLQRICVNSVSAGLIAEDVRSLIGAAESCIGEPCRLAGKLVTC